MKLAARIIIFLVMLIALTACANQSSQSQAISIEDAWARPGISGGNSAVYFVIENPSQQADKLLKAEADIAQFVELHMTSMDAEGNMRMQQQESVPVEAGAQVEFKPGGLHIMLIQLNRDLAAGETIPVTLQFENAGSIQIQAAVKQP
jgi:periplasmic copper chaperone A